VKILDLDVLQGYANEMARKLNTDCQPLLRWKQCTDECGELSSHCHTIEVSGQKRGTICIDDSDSNLYSHGWRWIVAHEVCHLSVKNCDLPQFAELMKQLGFS